MDWLGDLGTWLSDSFSGIGDWFKGLTNWGSGSLANLGGFTDSGGNWVPNLPSSGVDYLNYASNWGDTALPGTIESAIGSGAINDYSGIYNTAGTGGNSLMPGEWDWMKGGKIGGMQMPGLLEGGLGLAKYLMNQSMANNTRQSGQQAAQMSQGPFASQYALYQQKLRDLYAHPEGVANIPGYQAGLNSGVEQIRRNNAKMGRLDSGNINYDLLNFGSKYAMDQFNAQAQQLAGLSGVNMGNYGQAGKALYDSNREANMLDAYGLQALADPFNNGLARTQLQDQYNQYANSMKTGNTL